MFTLVMKKRKKLKNFLKLQNDNTGILVISMKLFNFGPH